MFKPTKKDLQQSVTVGDFVEFSDFIVENVATKKDVEAVSLKVEAVSLRLEAVSLKLIGTDAKIEAVETRLEKSMSERFDKVMISNDKISKKLDTFLTEQAAISGNLDQYRDEAKEVTGLKKRVERLEAHSGVA